MSACGPALPMSTLAARRWASCVFAHARMACGCRFQNRSAKSWPCSRLAPARTRCATDAWAQQLRGRCSIAAACAAQLATHLRAVKVRSKGAWQRAKRSLRAAPDLLETALVAKECTGQCAAASGMMCKWHRWFGLVRNQGTEPCTGCVCAGTMHAGQCACCCAKHEAQCRGSDAVAH